MTFMLLYVGSGDAGVQVASFNAETGQLGELRSVAGGKSFFLAQHPRLPILYSLNEAADLVMAYRIESGGNLIPIGEAPSQGRVPCHLSVDPEGKFLVVANYSAGVVLLGLEPDGAFSSHTATFQPDGKGPHKRQEKPHPHGVTIAPDRSRVYVADLGIDRILALDVNPSTLQLEPAPEASVSTAPGAGPRHFVFAPNGRSAVAVNELDNTLSQFSYDSAQGALTLEQAVSMLPEGYDGVTWAAEVVYHPSGKACYASNRGEHSVVCFAVAEDGSLQNPRWLLDGGENPQHLAIDPSGRWLFVAFRSQNQVAVYPLDEASKIPGARAGTLAVSKPMCALLVKAD